ncbi:cytochrome P450 CYP72A219-like isoform X3 [Phoenix dactylifera]|uniref:Cytochrome P450 CYP72A219-like isoform X3 n=1 Tax=Phoenix dactylifera TaxID=42345 RepID=A0A8B9ALN6_PHODC|nr:cytochrome P450 CYP72A219-like isoform X3 [Phoenix dactylifera]
MGEFLPILPIASVLAVLLFCGLKAFYSLWWKPKALEKQLREQGVRGNPYRILYGDTKDEIRAAKEAWSKPIALTHHIAPRVAPFAYQTVQKYGKTSLVWIGTTPRVILWDPQTMREVLLDKLGQFQKPPFNPLVRLLARGVASLEGEEWAKRRRVITPAFHLEKLKGMVPAFLISCVDLIKRWQNLTSAEGSCEIDVWPEFQNLTGDVISRTAFGSSYEEGTKIFELQKEQAVLVIEAARVPYIPGFRFLPTAKNKRRMHIDREIKTMLRNMIEKKLNSMKMGGSLGTDLLGLLLQFSNNNDQKNYSITIDEVIEECKLFYFAGQETTSVWLTWTMILLSFHPNWQQRAREEVLKICGKNTPDFESVGHLKIVTMILYEVLRLYPPATSLFRRAIKETKLGDFSVPAGTDIWLPTILIHHDREFWGEDANEFNPERFSEGIAKASKVQNAFFPFGWGPRICLGQSFATIEAKMALATILQHFSFELSPSYAHAPYTVITLQPQFGAHIILHQLLY